MDANDTTSNKHVFKNVRMWEEKYFCICIKLKKKQPTEMVYIHGDT